MIKVSYAKSDEAYKLLEVKGHAYSDVPGKDLICAAVSSIIFGLMNALDMLDEKVQIKELDNMIIIENNSDSSIVNDYFELTLIQLKTIEESYSQFIKIERK